MKHNYFVCSYGGSGSKILFNYLCNLVMYFTCIQEILQSI